MCGYLKYLLSLCLIFTLLGVDLCYAYQVFDNAIGFTEQVLRLNNAVLGARWMTWKNTAIKEGTYKKSNTDKMYGMLKEAGVDKGQPINFQIRGHYAYRSRENLMDLYRKLNETNPVTFTLYSDDQYYFIKNALTPPNITEMREVIQFLGPENVYLQVSDEVRADLDLRGLSNPRPRSTINVNSAPPFLQLNFLSLIVAFTVVKFVELCVVY